MCLESLCLFTFHQLIVYNLQNKLIPLKRNLALPIWDKKCTSPELMPLELANFDLGHPVL